MVLSNHTTCSSVKSLAASYQAVALSTLPWLPALPSAMLLALIDQAKVWVPVQPILARAAPGPDALTERLIYRICLTNENPSRSHGNCPIVL